MNNSTRQFQAEDLREQKHTEKIVSSWQLSPYRCFKSVLLEKFICWMIFESSTQMIYTEEVLGILLNGRKMLWARMD